MNLGRADFDYAKSVTAAAVRRITADMANARILVKQMMIDDRRLQFGLHLAAGPGTEDVQAARPDADLTCGRMSGTTAAEGGGCLTGPGAKVAVAWPSC